MALDFVAINAQVQRLWAMFNGTSTFGAAGGDLTGTYPNPTLANSILGAWTPYTPTVDQGVSTNISKSVTYAASSRVGRTIFGEVVLSPSATGTAGSAITITLPVTAAASALQIGTGVYYDSSTNTTYVGVAYSTSTTKIAIFNSVAGAGDFVGSTPNIAVGSGDVMRFSFHYEAAS